MGVFELNIQSEDNPADTGTVDEEDKSDREMTEEFPPSFDEPRFEILGNTKAIDWND